MEGNGLGRLMPYRFLIVAAVLAAVFCLMPIQADRPDVPLGEENTRMAQTTENPPAASGVPAGADLSERTQSGAYLHRTVRYTPCGHSVQRREPLEAKLCGLSQPALEAEIGKVIPGARITGFTAQEVDIELEKPIPCPMHWMLRTGEGGRLQVLQNTTGEALSIVRETQVEQASLAEEERLRLLEGILFDDVQQLEGYLESIDS